jgi:hypothetical protein
MRQTKAHINTLVSGFVKLIDMEAEARGADVGLLGGVVGAVLFHGDPSIGSDVWRDDLPEEHKEEYDEAMIEADRVVKANEEAVHTAVANCAEGKPYVRVAYGDEDDKIFEVTCASTRTPAVITNAFVSPQTQ